MRVQPASSSPASIDPARARLIHLRLEEQMANTERYQTSPQPLLRAASESHWTKWAKRSVSQARRTWRDEIHRTTFIITYARRQAKKLRASGWLAGSAWLAGGAIPRRGSQDPPWGRRRRRWPAHIIIMMYNQNKNGKAHVGWLDGRQVGWRQCLHNASVSR